MLYGHLTYLDIQERAKEGWLAKVPTGCAEQQGPHLPVDVDTWFAETIARAAAEKAAHDYAVHDLVLPTISGWPVDAAAHDDR